ncbi:PAS domain S-box-containing protein [Maribacter dokdonensis]|uniref:sensor histidine kinase n=1 Tax=Maribacter dokdonensis TaxID=320912 RepID=UPI001B0DB89D|nr:PAS domain-containing sensor histidine kinase [Maribacter dokdonensis]CAG2531698.1 PAS domain S-box-containing protein [Maribacter dokdonensis]
MKLNHFFDASIDMLCIANYDGYFEDVNPAFIKLLGYDKEELMSRKINDFVFEEDKEVTQQTRASLHENKKLISFQNRYVTKSGGVVWLSWSAVPVDSEKLVYAIAKDITHEMNLKNARILEFAKMKTVNDDLVRLNYTTSHDLRAPLNNLISLFDVLDYNVLDDDTLQILRYMEISAKGVKESLENYLKLIENARKGLNTLREIYFDHVLAKTQNVLSSIIKNSKTSISYDFTLCKSVLFDNSYMESIFLNLITNAIKYTIPGEAPRIEIKTEFVDGKIVLYFKDYGQGFDMIKNGSKIFGLNERFNTEQDGKGVGLYLIHNQINSLGGTITVDSELNKGALFTIVFPTQ